MDSRSEKGQSTPSALAATGLPRGEDRLFMLMAPKIRCQSCDSTFLLSDLGGITKPLSASVSSLYIMIHAHLKLDRAHS